MGRMRITLCNEVMRELGLAAQCRLARALGYDGLEIAPFTLSPEPHRISKAEAGEIRRTVEGEGLEVSGLHWLLAAPDGLSITSEDAAVAERTREVGAALVRLCAALGGQYVVHGSPNQRVLAPGREDEGRARAAEYFGGMARVSEEVGIAYCLEPLARRQTAFLTTVEEAAELVARIGSPALVTMIDSCASAKDGHDVPALIRRWMPTGLIRHIHVNDPNDRGPGQGDLDFTPIVAALRETGYAGAIGVEPFDYVPDGPGSAARAIGYLQGVMAARSGGAV